MTKVRVPHEQASIESFHRDPEFAAEYLNAVLEDGDHAELMLALWRIAEANGGIAALARKAGLKSKTAYRTLSAKGNPKLQRLTALLRAMGMRLSVQILPK